MKKHVFFLPLAILFSSFSFAQTNYVDLVNPFIGTGGHGHTYPGATAPFGMMQLSPDTRLDGWDGCSAYHYSDSIMYGFSHTHLSGTGVSDYGDLLIKPFTNDELEPPKYLANKDFSSKFSHKNEKASPGYYSVKLNDGISAELTSSTRCGMHKYYFNKSKYNKILIDLEHRDIVTYSKIQFINDSTIVGARYSKAWAENQKFYFAIHLSKPIKHKFIYINDTLQNQFNTAIGTNLKAILLIPQDLKEFSLKVGISATSIDAAMKNLKAEMPTWDFNKLKDEIQKKWNSELSKIDFQDPSIEKQKIFYTALYHCFIVPNIFTNVDGTYLGRDFNVHKTDNFDYYTVFSLWDTYRAYHPLMTIIDRKRTTDFINTFIEQYKHGGLLPMWEFAANETFCMIGYHSIPVIADAIAKKIITNPSLIKQLLDAMIHSATRTHLGLKDYMQLGYIPADKESESVSKTLEYAYDDWCIAQVAKQIGDTTNYKKFIQRAQYFKNIFDPETGFFRPKKNSAFEKPFDPCEVNFNYTEANCWQYTFGVPQDIQAYINLLGGNNAFEAKLDTMFSTNSQTTGRNQVDITGLIGQYAHGNEPSHHIAYLYSYIGKPWKTQKITNFIMNEMYHNSPDGLIGNEDCGQMSAWYILSSMGLYQVNPADGNFVFGSPQMQKATIKLENGNLFTIECKNKTSENFYIQSVNLNGRNYPYSYIKYNDILAGGTLTFNMGNKPNENFGSTINSRPYSSIDSEKITTLPYFNFDSKTFVGKTKVEIKSINSNTIEYKTDKDEEWKIYKKPLTIKATTTIFARLAGDTCKFNVASCTLIKIINDKKIELFQEYSSQYTAGGASGLVDGQRGNSDFRTGGWQGYQSTDFTAIVDLGKTKDIHQLTLGCLQEARSWIWLPTYVEFYYSTDGKDYISLGKVDHNITDKILTAVAHDFTIDFQTVKAKYIKVFAKNYGTIPEWHLGKGGQAYIFVDEIIVD